jgi:hypothetical protein
LCASKTVDGFTYDEYAAGTSSTARTRRRMRWMKDCAGGEARFVRASA